MDYVKSVFAKVLGSSSTLVMTSGLKQQVQVKQFFYYLKPVIKKGNSP